MQAIGTEKKHPIESLICDPRFQARREMSPDVVEEYRAAYEAKSDLPAIEVFLVDGVLYVTDGFHRHAATPTNGFLRAKLVGAGSIEQAIWHACAANRTHGLRRSNEDKRRAVRLALDSGIGAEQSNIVIAKHVGVSDMLVSDVRRAWEAERTLGDVQESWTSSEKRRDSAGRMQPARKPRATEPAKPYPIEDDKPLPHEPDSLPAYGAALKSAAATCRSARMALRKVAMPNHLAQRFEGAIKAIESDLALSIPETCPRCAGRKCAHCKHMGYVDAGDASAMRARG